jgi:hypothetical protein
MSEVFTLLPETPFFFKIDLKNLDPPLIISLVKQTQGGNFNAYLSFKNKQPS